MKHHLLFFLCIVLLTSSLALSAFAHPGRTDANGGHWDHSTGEYHYHGEPDSSHSGGSNSGSTTNRDWSGSDSSSSDHGSSSGLDSDDILGIIAACVVLGPFVLLVLWILVITPIIDKINEFFHPLPKEQPTPEPPAKPHEDNHIAPPTEQEPPLSPPSPSNPTIPLSPPEEPPISIPRPKIRGSEDILHHTPPKASQTPKKAVAPPPSSRKPKTQIVRKPLEQYLAILDVNFDYFPLSQAELFAESIESPRGKRAVTDLFHFDEPIIDKTQKPYRVECGMFSANSLNYYEATLTSCTCPDHQTRHKICKHMIALALKIDALTVDVEMIKNNNPAP